MSKPNYFPELMKRAASAGCRCVVFVAKLDESGEPEKAEWTCAGRGIVVKGRTGEQVFRDLVEKMEARRG